MKSNLTTKEKEKILRKTIAEWKKEYKEYQTMLNIYLWIILIPFAFMCFALYKFDALVGYICTVITSFYTILAIVPTVDELGKINKCNVNNICNIKVGVIRRKYYKQRKFSIYLADITKYREIDIVRVTTSQFDKFRVSDTIIYFEFYPGDFAITYMPEELYDDDIEEIENNIYTPTKKDIEGFVKFRREITLYDNYLFYSIVIIILATAIAIGIVTMSYKFFAYYTIIPFLILMIIYAIFIKPRYPFKVSEIENCFKAIVVSKHKECKNKIRKYYYGKKYYYVTVVNSKGEEIEKVRILKKTFENIKKGDKVICFDYRRPSLLLGEKAAIKDLNDIDNKKEVN